MSAGLREAKRPTHAVHFLGEMHTGPAWLTDLSGQYLGFTLYVDNWEASSSAYTGLIWHSSFLDSLTEIQSI